MANSVEDPAGVADDWILGEYDSYSLTSADMSEITDADVIDNNLDNWFWDDDDFAFVSAEDIAGNGFVPNDDNDDYDDDFEIISEHSSNEDFTDYVMSINVRSVYSETSHNAINYSHLPPCNLQSSSVHESALGETTMDGAAMDGTACRMIKRKCISRNQPEVSSDISLHHCGSSFSTFRTHNPHTFCDQSCRESCTVADQNVVQQPDRQDIFKCSFGCDNLSLNAVSHCSNSLRTLKRSVSLDSGCPSRCFCSADNKVTCTDMTKVIKKHNICDKKRTMARYLCFAIIVSFGIGLVVDGGTCREWTHTELSTSCVQFCSRSAYDILDTVTVSPGVNEQLEKEVNGVQGRPESDDLRLQDCRELIDPVTVSVTALNTNCEQQMLENNLWSRKFQDLLLENTKLQLQLTMLRNQLKSDLNLARDSMIHFQEDTMALKEELMSLLRTLKI